MLWKNKNYQCTKCTQKACFRYAYKRVQFFSHTGWVDVHPSAEIVILECGDTFFIPQELKSLAEIN
jgi:hypothetical protein